MNIEIGENLSAVLVVMTICFCVVAAIYLLR